MSTTGNGQESLGDDFFEQILSVPTGYTDPSAAASNSADDIPMFLQLGSGGPSPGAGGGGGGATSAADIRSLAMGISMGMMPLGLNLEHSFLRQHEDHNSNHNNNNTNASSSPPNNSSATSGINERDSVQMPSLFPAFGQLQSQSARPPPPRPPQVQQFQSQAAAAPQPPAVRPRVRARRGQATDPHSIAERLRRERIADRMRALQELVPSCNKTDRAAMLDEIVDYVKFLRLQVKVLSMSRLGAAGAVAQLVADVPLSSALEGESIDGGSTQPEWEKWSNDGTEQQVAKLMEEDIGAAMQFLQSKALCIMPISLASAIYRTRQPDAPAFVKPESSTPS